MSYVKSNMKIEIMAFIICEINVNNKNRKKIMLTYNNLLMVALNIFKYI